MLILLPPSETKQRPSGDAPPLDLGALTPLQLREDRARMLALAARTAREADGASLLGVPASSPELRERMQRIASEPVAPALQVYTGVLYEALQQSLRSEGRPALAGTSAVVASGEVRVLVTSALLGAVDAAADSIPAYRLSATSRLRPESGRAVTAGAWWRPRLKALGGQLAAEHELVLDCRSGGYRSMMPIAGALEVKAVRERAGKRSVISHDAKRYRGLLTGAVLVSGQVPRRPADVREIALEHLPDGLDVELAGSALTIVDRTG